MEDRNIEMFAKQCSNCTRNTLLPNEYEWKCFSCGYKVIKRNELGKIQRKKVTISIH